MSDNLVRKALVLAFIMNVALFGMQWKTLHDIRDFKTNYEERVSRIDVAVKNLTLAYDVIEDKLSKSACAK